MNHQQFREWLPLFAYRELGEKSKVMLEDHLQACSSCRAELAEIQKLHSVLDKPAAYEPSKELLMEARQQLRGALRAERTRVTLWDRVKERFTVVVPDYRQVLGAAATLIIGVFIGYVAFARIHPPANTAQLPAKNQTEPSVVPGDAEISNVKFINSDIRNGKVEFTFDAVKPVKVKGNINDPEIQKVLTYALVNEQNPGVRLRAVNALGSPDQKATDPVVKNALITAMKSDENPGVRKEALEVLAKFPMDEEIKQALLYILVHDRSAGMRIAAIKSLEAGRQIDKDVVNVLKQKVQSDENDYIRLKARDVLQEVKQQQ